MVRRLVEMHGGTVTAHSDGIGRGTEMVVRLPLQVDTDAEVRHRKRRTKDEASLQTIGRRMLVVDDNRDAADSIALLLEVAGHEVRTAYDGPDALNLASVFKPEVVILDLGLPTMDGFEIARQIEGQQLGQGHRARRAHRLGTAGGLPADDRCRLRRASGEAGRARRAAENPRPRSSEQQTGQIARTTAPDT